MKVLVTGAQGCIGAWVIKALLDRGDEVVMFDVAPEPGRLNLVLGRERAAKLRLETGRIEDTSRIKSLVKDGEFTGIVHLAAVLMPFCQANPVEGGLIDVIGTLNVFEAARDSGREVRIVYASSSAVWGPEDAYAAGGKLTEADPTKPQTHYGVFKQANEGNARAFYAANGISSIGLRPWTVYGPGRDRGLTADPTLAMEAVAAGKPFEIRLSGFMDLQYVEDVAETFVRCLESPLAGAHVFNLEGAVVSMESLIDSMAAVRPAARELITFAGPQVPVAYRLDASELRAKVPGIASTTLEAGIRRTIEIFEQANAR